MVQITASNKPLYAKAVVKMRRRYLDLGSKTFSIVVLLIGVFFKRIIKYLK
jgi:hypothetical protein